MAFIWRKLRRKRNINVNESTISILDSNQLGQGQGFFDSQAARFVSKMGMELDQKIIQLPGVKKDSGLDKTKRIKVKSVKFGTYFHGYGMRENDVIASVNDRPITSAASVDKTLYRVINLSFNSRVKINAYRSGTEESKGTLVNVLLDNNGTDPSIEESNIFQPIGDPEEVTIKSAGSNNYLKVLEGSIALGELQTDANGVDVTIFRMQTYGPQYLLPTQPEQTFVTLQHTQAGGGVVYICVNSGSAVNLTTTPPGNPILAPNDYLFLIRNVSPTTVNFQPSHHIGQAIGFSGAACVLLPVSNPGTHFQIF